MVSLSSVINSNLIDCDIFFLSFLARHPPTRRFKELPGKVDAAFNTAPSVSLFVTNLAVRMSKKNYKDTFNLAELDLHNGIEHDASLTRTYFFFCGVPRI